LGADNNTPVDESKDEDDTGEEGDVEDVDVDEGEDTIVDDLEVEGEQADTSTTAAPMLWEMDLEGIPTEDITIDEAGSR